eukprot:15407199-Alexandrium_andersonii.AAC.1
MLKNTRSSANEARAGWTGLACRDACSVAEPTSAVASASVPVLAGPDGPASGGGGGGGLPRANGV